MSYSVIHSLDGLDTRLGGPPRTVVYLSNALVLQKRVSNVGIVSQGSLNESIILPSSNVYLEYKKSYFWISLKLGIPALEGLVALSKKFHNPIIHSHGIWSSSSFWASNVARIYGFPLVIQPMGTLSPYALRIKARKKVIAMSLYQGSHLKAANALVATSELELGDIRKCGLKNPVAIIPNGVNIPDLIKFSKKNVTAANSQTRVALFLSRIHPIKGLLNLVEAWHEILPQGWQLHIAGGDDCGHLNEVMSLVKERGLNSSIKYIGEISEHEKGDIYRKSELFILPSFSENFGLVIAEAMAYGLPVITTKGAPWSDLIEFKCGWWINADKSAIAMALKSATSMEPGELSIMGERARRYIMRYGWSTVAEKTAALYAWIQRCGPMPDFIDN